MPWLQLIRWKNLLIIFFTQLLAWWCVVLPLSPEILNPVNFCALALSTVLIAAAGYIINDYFDIKIDLINKPEKVVVEKIIPRKQAILSHIILNAIALILAAYVAAQAHHFSWLVIQLASISLLWFYSAELKRMFMAGNIVVSVLTALTIIMLIIYEPVLQRYMQYPALKKTGAGNEDINPAWILLVYAFFAFTLTWAREIVKDIEDLKGDTEQGCVTVPVKWGISGAVKFIGALVFITLLALGGCGIYLLIAGNIVLGMYVGVFLTLPLVAWLLHLSKNFTVKHFHQSSSRIKWIMLSGIASLIVYHCIVWIRSY